MNALLLTMTVCLAGDALATPVDGRPFSAVLVRIADDGAVFRAAEGERVLSAEALVDWGGMPDAERGAWIALADGSLLVGDVLAIDDKSLTLGDATGLGRGWWPDVKLPLTLVRGVVLQPSADPLLRDKQRRRAFEYRRTQDGLQLVDGRTIAGLLLPSTNNTVRFQVRGLTQPAELPFAKIAAVDLANLGGEAKLTRATWTLALDDGARLSVAEIAAGPTFKLACGITLTPTLDDPGDAAPFWSTVRFVAGSSPRVAYVSERPPQQYEHRPLLTGKLPLGRDVNAVGGPLRFRDKLYPRGLGMHADGAATYATAGRYRRFEADCFVDESAGDQGSVIFVVAVEKSGAWKEIFASEILRGGDTPERIALPLDGAERVKLEVRSADRGDVLDCGNWGSARWIE